MHAEERGEYTHNESFCLAQEITSRKSGQVMNMMKSSEYH